MILVSPMIVAIGITFSRWIELLSVVLYIISLSGFIFMAWKTPFVSCVTKVAGPYFVWRTWGDDYLFIDVCAWQRFWPHFCQHRLHASFSRGVELCAICIVWSCWMVVGRSGFVFCHTFFPSQSNSRSMDDW